MSEFISVHTEQFITTVTIERLEAKNAINQAMYKALGDAFIEANQSCNTRVVLLKGAADIFTSGNDLGDFMAMAKGKPDEYGTRFMKALVNCEKPIIASVSGAAVGIGMTLLQHVDFIYAADTAVFMTPFITLGLSPECASSKYLERAIGQRKAKAMLLSNEPLNAREALQLGFVNQVSDQPDAVALKKAQQLAELPPLSMQLSKNMLSDDRQALCDLIEQESIILLEQLTKPEAQEAISAFIEKRKPVF